MVVKQSLTESLVSVLFYIASQQPPYAKQNNNVERAIDWIFNHPEELSSGGGGSAMETDEGAAGGSLSAEASAASFRDGSEKYKLVAFISHMGTSTMCGHYVCHILKDDKWVIFNDNKVAVSEHPPKELAYLYLYRRI